MGRRCRFALLLGALSCAGCAPFLSVLPAVISAVADAIPILDQVERWIEGHATEPTQRDRALAAVDRCRAALVTDARKARLASSGAEADAAFGDFRSAWRELRAELAAMPGAPKAAAAPGAAQDIASGAVFLDPLVVEHLEAP